MLIISWHGSVMQYNLALDNGLRHSAAGKVTTGLAKSNYS